MFLVASIPLYTLKKFLIAWDPLPILATVLVTSAASAAGFKPPCKAAAPNKTNSSTAILLIIPAVYAEFNNKLTKIKAKWVLKNEI